MKRGIAEVARVGGRICYGRRQKPRVQHPSVGDIELPRAKYQQDGFLFVVGDPAHDTL